MENLFAEDSDSLKPKGEEIPIEEVEKVKEDYNAIAWKRIQARDAKALKIQSLANSLALKPTYVLKSVLKVCVYEQQDEELQELIRAELKRRPDTADPDMTQ